MAPTPFEYATTFPEYKSPVEYRSRAGLVAVAVAFACLSGTGGTTSPDFVRYRGERGYPFPQITIPLGVNASFPGPLENLNQIRTTFKLSISDLAHALNVSRQTVYNWMAGELPSQERASGLQDLAQAADFIAARGLNSSAYLSKRKIMNGKTLIDIVRDGGSAQGAAVELVRLAEEESRQRELLRGKLAGRQPAKLDSLDLGIPQLDEDIG